MHQEHGKKILKIIYFLNFQLQIYIHTFNPDKTKKLNILSFMFDIQEHAKRILKFLYFSNVHLQKYIYTFNSDKTKKLNILSFMFDIYPMSILWKLTLVRQ